MEWEKIGSVALDCGDGREEEEVRGAEGMGEGVLYVKVMTDEQMEILRRQIAVYATICEQLVEMHKALSAQQDSLAGLRFGGLCCDPMLGSSKIGSRQRWTPTPMQLQVLENIFDKGNGTPSKQRIKDLTLELSKLGHISETNVYNWFQNRRARSKRRQIVTAEFDLGSSVDKKAKPETSVSDEPPLTPVDPSSFNFDDMSYGLCNPSSLFDVSRADNMVGKMFYTGIDHLA